MSTLFLASTRPTTASSIVQSITTLIGGSIIGLIYAWKPSVVGIGARSCSVVVDFLVIGNIIVACLPFLISPGYIRLVSLLLQRFLPHLLSDHKACRRLERPTKQKCPRTFGSAGLRSCCFYSHCCFPHSAGTFREIIQPKSGRASQKIKQDHDVEQFVVCILTISNALCHRPRLLVWCTARV